MPLAELTRYLDAFLRIREIPDRSLNGLQVDGPEAVGRVALATDAALQTFEQAAAGGAQLLVVHHGLFWGETAPVVGQLRRRIQTLLEAGMALYCAHLPLDAHPEVGNNAALARELGLESLRPFGAWRGSLLGFGGDLPRELAPEELRAHCEARLGGPVRLLPFGGGRARRLAVVSGAAADLATEAAREGYDAFLTGETSHAAYHPAREAGVHLLFAGHYATETWGVRALGEHLARRFGVEVFFCDAPTGF
ncbi:MAG: Nif3-like dinuclear metal center hexameric protein [Gemmatimonadota bacterium]